MKIKFTLILCIFSVHLLLAQNNVDSLFSKAREKAFSKDYKGARTICDQILKYSPGYVDAAVLAGRTYSWNGQYDSAKISFARALDAKPAYYDAINAMIDAHAWGDDNSGALKFCNYGLQKYPGDKELTIRKIKALKNLMEYGVAKQIIDSMLQKEPKNDTILAVDRALRVAAIANKLTLSYTLDLFDNNSPTPWQLTYLQYSRKMSWGSAIARINYGDRFDTKGMQYEVDAYPSLGSKMYGYLNAGVSNVSIFPAFRFGAELYRSMPKGLEVSAGLRYLQFTSTNVTIFTLYAGKYLGNNWFSLRTFITPSNSGTSVSGGFVMRHYLSDADSYIGFGTGIGSSPDDRTRNLQSAEYVRLKSYNFKINYSKRIADFWIFTLGFTYENQEFISTSPRNDYTFDISLSHLF